MQLLHISRDKRHIIYQDGSPFFYLADTVWELFHRYKREEVDQLFENRAEKGFTAIQACVMSLHDTLRSPNHYGHLPLKNMDPTTPDERYFAHVDYVVDKAESLGLFIAMLPTWGDKVAKKWGSGPEIFDRKNAYAYGEFIAKRYKGRPVIWVNGGDRDPSGYEDVWNALGNGLRSGSAGKNLITGHFSASKGFRSSSRYFHKQPWLDINMAYSGHYWDFPVHELIEHERNRKPSKPVFDGEPKYENHPYIGDGSGFNANPGAWDGITRAGSQQIRQPAYWAMLAGACGHAYGCNDIWQKYDLKENPTTYANTHWKHALHFEGSYQMGLMRRFFESRPWQELRPDNSIIVKGQMSGRSHIQAAIALNRSFAMAYIPHGTPITINTSMLKAQSITSSWYSPKNGAWTIAKKKTAIGSVRFVPPESGNISDWVLVLDNSSKGFPINNIEIPGVPKRIVDVFTPPKLG